jgi:hypothetical protein
MIIYTNTKGEYRYILKCVDMGSTCIYKYHEGVPTIEVIKESLRDARKHVESKNETLIFKMQ